METIQDIDALFAAPASSPAAGPPRRRVTIQDIDALFPVTQPVTTPPTPPPPTQPTVAQPPPVPVAPIPPVTAPPTEGPRPTAEGPEAHALRILDKAAVDDFNEAMAMLARNRTENQAGGFTPVNTAPGFTPVNTAPSPAVVQAPTELALTRRAGGGAIGTLTPEQEAKIRQVNQQLGRPPDEGLASRVVREAGSILSAGASGGTQALHGAANALFSGIGQIATGKTYTEKLQGAVKAVMGFGGMIPIVPPLIGGTEAILKGVQDLGINLDVPITSGAVAASVRAFAGGVIVSTLPKEQQDALYAPMTMKEALEILVPIVIGAGLARGFMRPGAEPPPVGDETPLGQVFERADRAMRERSVIDRLETPEERRARLAEPETAAAGVTERADSESPVSPVRSQEIARPGGISAPVERGTFSPSASERARQTLAQLEGLARQAPHEGVQPPVVSQRPEITPSPATRPAEEPPGVGQYTPPSVRFPEPETRPAVSATTPLDPSTAPTPTITRGALPPDVDAAMTRLKAAFGGERGSLKPGAALSSDLLRDAVTVGRHLVTQGVTDFTAWSERMLQEVGNRVKPYLGRIWNNVRVEAEIPTTAARYSPVAITDGLKKMLAPAARGPDAATTAGIVRQNAAELAQKKEQARHVLRRAASQLEGETVETQRAFIHAIETGSPQPLPQYQGIANTLRQMLDDRRAQVQALGRGALEHFIENYFPHLWKPPGQTGNPFARIAGRRPLAGPASFLKPRTIPTYQEGIAAGLEPVTTNPVEMALLKLYEMDRFIAGQKIFQEMKDQGLVTFVRAGKQAPSGFAPIDDTIARVRSFSEEAGGFVIRGAYYAPEPAARILNNYLSKPLMSRSLAFDAFRRIGNGLNMSQLGISAFHLSTTSLNAVISDAALSIQELAAGRPLAAGRRLLLSPTAPVRSLFSSSTFLKEFYAPGSQGEEMAALVQAFLQGGGRVKMEDFYRVGQSGKFLQDLRAAHREFGAGNPLKGLGYGGRSLARAIPAILDLAAAPTMQFAVPRLKIGAFLDLARFELSRLPETASEADRRAVMGRAWDSIDNRFGQLVYDNLFWNRAGKDMALATFRSVGWNYGTWRELGGGALDATRALRAGSTGRPVEITPRLAYTLALPAQMALYGSLVQYLFTGTGPETLFDALHPKIDAAGHRIDLPSYMKETESLRHAARPLARGRVVESGHRVGTTVVHKLNPAVAEVFEMLSNRDYYGAMIVAPGDSGPQEIADIVRYLERTNQPFTFTNFERLRSEGASPGRAAASILGAVPTPTTLLRTEEDETAMAQRANRDAIRKKHLEDAGLSPFTHTRGGLPVLTPPLPRPILPRLR